MIVKQTNSTFAPSKNNNTMTTTKTIQSALISVFDKTGLEPIVQKLHNQNVTIYSTGGTEEFIKNLGIPVVPVEEVTSYPSILGGRVKTLHPKVFGGILNRQDNPSDIEEMKAFEIPQIDLVPTLFGLLNWSYNSEFYGKNIFELKASGSEKEYIMTLQKTTELRTFLEKIIIENPDKK